jgi:hypothetical protein
MLGASVEILLERPALGPRGNGNAYWPGHTIPLCSASRYRVSREGVTTRAPEAGFELPNLVPEAAHMPPSSVASPPCASIGLPRGAVGIRLGPARAAIVRHYGGQFNMARWRWPRRRSPKLSPLL